jgi:hypothetical protein
LNEERRDKVSPTDVSPNKRMGCFVPWMTHPSEDESPGQKSPGTRPFNRFFPTLNRTEILVVTSLFESALPLQSYYTKYLIFPSLSKRVGTAWSGTHQPKRRIIQGRNIREFSFGDTTILHRTEGRYSKNSTTKSYNSVLPAKIVVLKQSPHLHKRSKNIEY